MKERIVKELKRIEQKENVEILLAVESGSRAWGFESPDSDYDVRFIYKRRAEDYLRLDEMRDVIEIPIDDVLDINGWDLKKTLQLLYKSNPTLFEWFASPIIYKETDFAAEFRSVMGKYFSSKSALWHYISMAKSNYREYLKTEMVKAKKYFYVLRPVLACRWILDKQSPPPMLFSELADEELPAELRNEVEYLLDIKTNNPEIKEIPRIDSINNYLASEIEDIRNILDNMKEDRKASWMELNELFLYELGKESREIDGK